MYAVISHRTATNVTVGEQVFEHQRWTLIDTLPDAVKAAAEVPLGQKHPELRVIEVDGPKDPRLGGLPVAGEEDAPVPPISPAAPLPDMDTLSDAAVKRLARSLSINGNQPRIDLVMEIKALHAATETSEEASQTEGAGGEQTEDQNQDQGNH